MMVSCSMRSRTDREMKWNAGRSLSAGQFCDPKTRPMHVASRTAVCGFSTIADDATALG